MIPIQALINRMLANRNKSIRQLAKEAEEALENVHRHLLQNDNELSELKERADKAEEFIREIFKISDWPEGGDIDGFELQDAAVKHGYLVPEIRKEPCGEGCNCETYYSSDEWEDGVTCYRLSASLMKGEK